MKKKQKCDRHFYVALGCGKYYAVIEENDCHKIYIISPCICEKCKDFEFGSLNPSIFPHTQEATKITKMRFKFLRIVSINHLKNLKRNALNIIKEL